MSFLRSLVGLAALAAIAGCSADANEPVGDTHEAYVRMSPPAPTNCRAQADCYGNATITCTANGGTFYEQSSSSYAGPWTQGAFADAASGTVKFRVPYQPLFEVCNALPAGACTSALYTYSASCGAGGGDDWGGGGAGTTPY